MFISGMIMVTRNRYVCVHLQPHARGTQLLAHTCPWACRYLAWPAFLLSLNSVINQHPLRTKEGGQNNVSVLMCVICSFPPSPRVLRRTHLYQAGHCRYHCIVSSSGHDHTAKGCRAWCLMYTHGILDLSLCFSCCPCETRVTLSELLEILHEHPRLLNEDIVRESSGFPPVSTHSLHAKHTGINHDHIDPTHPTTI